MFGHDEGTSVYVQSSMRKKRPTSWCGLQRKLQIQPRDVIRKRYGWITTYEIQDLLAIACGLGALDPGTNVRFFDLVLRMQQRISEYA